MGRETHTSRGHMHHADTHKVRTDTQTHAMRMRAPRGHGDLKSSEQARKKPRQRAVHRTTSPAPYTLARIGRSVAIYARLREGASESVV